MTSNITAVQKKNYLKRVRKIWRRRDVVEINQQHAKYAFTQYVRQGMQLALCKSQHKVSGKYDWYIQLVALLYSNFGQDTE